MSEEKSKIMAVKEYFGFQTVKDFSKEWSKLDDAEKLFFREGVANLQAK